MSKVFDQFIPGFPVTLQLSKANPSAEGDSVLTLAQGNGFVVPEGYTFRPLYLVVKSNVDLSAGAATFKLASDGTAITGYHTCILSHGVQFKQTAFYRKQTQIPAGSEITVIMTADAAYLPVTADMDAVLFGVLEPAT